MTLPSVSWARGRFVTPALAFGASPLGPLGTLSREQEALTLVAEAFACGLRYFDVSPYYGVGLAELRLGAVLRHLPRDEIIVSTKVGRLLTPTAGGGDADRLQNSSRFDYTADATWRSLEDSLARLSLARIDLALVHDLSTRWHGARLDERMAEALAGAFPTLVRLRREGVIRAIGIGTNDPDAAQRAIEAVDLDVVMLAGAPTLLHNAACAPLLAACAQRGVDVIAAAPFNSGILATGARRGARYFYQPAPEPILAAVRRLEAACARHDLALGAAALQAPLQFAPVKIVLPGFGNLEEFRQGLAWFGQRIGDDAWRALDVSATQPPPGPAG